VDVGDANEPGGEVRAMQRLVKERRSRTEKLKQNSYPKFTKDTVEGRGLVLML
jgi:hypothetical protein